MKEEKEAAQYNSSTWLPTQLAKTLHMHAYTHWSNTHCFPFRVGLGLLEKESDEPLDLLVCERAGTNYVRDSRSRKHILGIWK